MTRTASVEIGAGTVAMEGVLALPPDAIGMVLFAHGSGSSRLSPRNNHVAAALREAGIGTLLPDCSRRTKTWTMRSASTSACSPNASAAQRPGWERSR